MTDQSVIKIELPGMGVEETAKINNCFVKLLDIQFFKKSFNGKITLNFNEGNIMEIWYQNKIWQRKKRGA